MEEQRMIRAKYYKRTPDATERRRFITESDSIALAAADVIASNIKVSYCNDKGTILMVEAEVDGDENLKAINLLLADNGFSTDLDTMLRKA